MDKNKIKEKAKKLIRTSKVFIFSTVDGNFPRSRFMGSLVNAGGFRYYMETFALSNKVAQIKKNPRAELLFFGKGLTEVVNLLGKARIVDSIKIKEHVFNSFPESGKYFVSFKQKDFGVIEFKAETLEYYISKSHQHFKVKL